MPSRIGKKLITLPSDVKIEETQNFLKIIGPKGTLEVPKFDNIEIKSDKNQINCLISQTDNKVSRAYQGLERSLLANAVRGVSEPWEKKLEIVGVGFRVIPKSDQELEFALGFSHLITVKALPGITFATKGNSITVSGIDKQKVGQQAAIIRSLKKPEPYKGKGIRYSDEHVRRKAGKTAKAVGSK